MNLSLHGRIYINSSIPLSSRMCFLRWRLGRSCLLWPGPALIKLIAKPQEDLCNLWAKISYAHLGFGLLFMTYKVQEDEVGSLELNDEDIAFNALFPQRCSVFEDKIIWPCWSWRFLSMLQLNVFVKVALLMLRSSEIFAEIRFSLTFSKSQNQMIGCNMVKSRIYIQSLVLLTRPSFLIEC